MPEWKTGDTAASSHRDPGTLVRGAAGHVAPGKTCMRRAAIQGIVSAPLGLVAVIVLGSVFGLFWRRTAHSSELIRCRRLA